MKAKYDPLFEEAAREAVSSQMISTSMIQRNYEVGFNRAGRIMMQLERAGIVGKQQGAKPREILFHDLSSLEARLQELKNEDLSKIIVPQIMKIKYIVKSESQGTYLTYATDFDRQQIPNQVYTFKTCNLDYDVIKFDSKEEAISAYEEILKTHGDSYNPVILEIIVSE